MAGIGAPELIIILVILLVIFGGTKLPKLARSLGEAQKEFRAGTDEANRAAAAPPRTEAEIREDELRVREAELRRREEALRRQEEDERR